MPQDISKMSYIEKLHLAQQLREDLGGQSRFDSDDFMELAISWAKGEITVTVIREIIGNNNYASCCAIGLRRALKQGRLIEAKHAGVEEPAKEEAKS